MNKTNTQSDRYAVIGNPIEHSKSPEIHAQFACQTQQALSYERLLAPLDGFLGTVQDFVREGGRGMNVTVPFKLEAAALATRLTECAEAAGAVNTLLFNSGEIVGDNTDGIGLVQDIVKNANVAIAGKSVLLLGAGGAARGVILPLLDQKLARLVLANRTPARAQELAAQFAKSGTIEVATFESINGVFDIVINATAASLSAEVLPIPPSVFAPHTLAYDMMYSAAPTAFMVFAAAHGAQVRDGLGMLVEQAAESFSRWRGVRPETAEVFAQLRAQIENKG